jgi:hypothetical protein
MGLYGMIHIKTFVKIDSGIQNWLWWGGQTERDYCDLISLLLFLKKSKESKESKLIYIYNI